MPDPAPPDLTPLIQQAALEPASASGSDGRSASSHSLPDLITADRYLAGKEALRPVPGRTRSAWGKVRQVQAMPPGST